MKKTKDEYNAILLGLFIMVETAVMATVVSDTMMIAALRGISLFFLVMIAAFTGLKLSGIEIVMHSDKELE